MTETVYYKLKERLRIGHSATVQTLFAKEKEAFFHKNDGKNTCENCHFLIPSIKRCKKKNKFLYTLTRICQYHELKRTPTPETTAD